MEGFLTSAGTKIRRNHQDCNHSSGCRRVWLMLPEMQRGRRAESAQAGSRSLQTQTRGDQTGPAGKVPGVCLMQAGTEPWPGARHYLCRERGARVGEESGPRCSQDPGSHSGLDCPRPPVLAQPLRGGAEMPMASPQGPPRPSLNPASGWSSAHSPDSAGCRASL